MYFVTRRFVLQWGFVPSFVVRFLDRRTNRLIRAGALHEVSARAGRQELWAVKHRLGFWIYPRD